MFIVLYACLLVSMAGATLDDSQYCAIRYRRLCQGKGRHVACQFPEIGPGLSCENYTEIKFTDDLKHYVTHYINRRRQSIAAGSEKVRGGLHLPKPQLMMLVEWDRELAYLAQRLADQCHFVHDDCRATVRYPYAGQTVGEVRWRRSSDSDLLSAQRGIRRVLDAWWGEKRRVLPRQLTSPFRLISKGAVWGHFTQLAVWTLRAVGCGAVRHGIGKPRLLLVCDFSHTNMLGQKTISPGPLAPCPMHTIRRPRSQYPLLCGPVRHVSELQAKQNDDYADIDDESEETEDVDARNDNNKINSKGNKKLKAKFLTSKKAFIIDKIEQELRQKGEQIFRPTQTLTYVTYHDQATKWKYFGKWRERESDENAEDHTSVEEMIPITTLRPKAPPTVASRRKETYVDQESPSRFRWKQTRHRPTRPGANALLSMTPKPLASLGRQSMGSLVLDKDEVDQLFKDTGFSMAWKKQSQEHIS